MKHEIKIGDWVNSYSKGIYRVEKIIDQYYDESSTELDGNRIGDKMKDRIIVSKRLLNSKSNKSIGYENCSEYFVSKLGSAQIAEIQNMLSGNPKFLNELNEYQIPTLTTVYNFDLKIDNDKDLQTVLKLIGFIQTGKTFLEIQMEMERHDILRLQPKYFGNYIFQLFNFDEEYINKRKIWRDAKLIKS